MENLTLFSLLLSLMMLAGVIGFVVVAIMAVAKLRQKNYVIALIIFGALVLLSLVLIGVLGAGAYGATPAILP